MTSNTSDGGFEQREADELEIDRRISVIREIDRLELAGASTRYPVSLLRDIASQVSRVADCLERRSESAVAVLERRTHR